MLFWLLTHVLLLVGSRWLSCRYNEYWFWMFESVDGSLIDQKMCSYFNGLCLPTFSESSATCLSSFNNPKYGMLPCFWCAVGGIDRQVFLFLNSRSQYHNSCSALKIITYSSFVARYETAVWFKENTVFLNKFDCLRLTRKKRCMPIIGNEDKILPIRFTKMFTVWEIQNPWSFNGCLHSVPSFWLKA